MKFIKHLASLVLISTSTLAVAAPIDTQSAVGGFLSWRDCTAAEQNFCDGSVGSTTLSINNGTGDRSIIGDVDISSLNDQLGPNAFGSSAYDVGFDATGAFGNVAAVATNIGRVGSTVGGYQSYTYTGDAQTTLTLDVDIFYSHSGGFDELAGEGSAWTSMALFTTASDPFVVDPDNHFMGVSSIGRDTAFDLYGGFFSPLNTVTIVDQFTSEDPQLTHPTVSNQALNYALSILVNPGDTFYLSIATQSVANQGGSGAISYTATFDDSDIVTGIAVPAPAGAALLLLGFVSLLLRRH